MLSLTARTRSGCDSPPPALIPESETVCCGASSEMDRSGSGASVGESLTGVTVTLNVRLNFSLSPEVDRSRSAPPSSTVTVMVVNPERSATGAKRSVPVLSGLV